MEMKSIYSWKAGSHCTGNAGKVGTELEALGDQVTPDAVVAYAAKHKKSELHSQFEWNNEIAGHLHRLNQARHLLACIVIEKETVSPKGKKEIVITRAYENIKVSKDETEKRVYVPIDAALSVPEHREYVIESIRRAIGDLQEKARAYETYLKNSAQFNLGLDSALKAV
jgi:predicted transcriptional regulator